ncbi:MAG: hypothetical protein H0W82_04250 [Actinobacteria bacterium]|nr:hypothetical protein [Actinomycetota bacterium]
MVSPSPSKLPRVVLSSVVRSAYEGESHGGVYLVDLNSGSTEQLLDWNDPSIDWEGRGGDRGLRGIAFHGDRLHLAASDEIFFYDRHLTPLGSIRNPYLKHCHEIFVAGDTLFATSTGFDSVLEMDLTTGRFVRGYTLRFARIWRGRRRLGLRPRPTFSVFDPNGADGPEPGDTAHINNVSYQDATLYLCGTGLGTVWSIRDDRLRRYAHVPYGSHNARPFRGGVLLNHTPSDRIVHVSRRGRELATFPIVRYEPSELKNASLPKDKARQAFGRGLAIVSGDRFVGGSSPATVTLYGVEPPEVIDSINITKDVRNAVHGLAVWPFDD